MKLPPFLFQILLVSSLLSNNVAALTGWTKVSKSIEATVFYDSKSIQRTNDSARMWVLTNFTKPLEIESKLHQSSKTRFEYDCAGERSRVEGTFFYALPDGKGVVTAAESSANEWYPIAPQSIGLPLWKVACKK